MKLPDIFLLAGNNLKQNMVRTILTTLGVTIGIGSLAAMVSFGQGIQQNIAQAIEKNDMFTGMTVGSKIIDYENFSLISSESTTKHQKTIIDDSLIAKISRMPDVAIVFPEKTTPAAISIFGRQTNVVMKAIPAEMKNFRPFDNIKYGNFYFSDNDLSVVISKAVLNKMGIILTDDATSNTTKQIAVHPDSIINHKLEIITNVFDPDKIDLINQKSNELPLKQEITKLNIVGIVENNSFSAGIFSNGIFLPTETCQNIPCVDVNNIYNIIHSIDNQNTYNSLHVRVKEFKNLEPVKANIENLGLQVFSIGDKLKDFEKLFYLLDSLLAAIGSIALLIAALGIVNTLMMAIYERRKEIGIMKSLGATERQIRLIFYIEATTIGLIGGLLGIISAKLASIAANSIANSQIGNIINDSLEYFSFSWQLSLGAIVFSMAISFAAAIYPAAKASKIDPLEALRRE